MGLEGITFGRVGFLKRVNAEDYHHCLRVCGDEGSTPASSRTIIQYLVDMCKFVFAMKIIQLKSTITCPVCGYSKEETMPEDACSFFYECENCKTVLKPKKGDCCVYCSYGTVKCPPVQAGEKCC